MTPYDLEIMKEKCKLAENILSTIKDLEDRIRTINAELSHFQGDKNLMIRDKGSNYIVPKDIFPYNPIDEELIQLGTVIQQIFSKKIATLKAELDAM